MMTRKFIAELIGTFFLVLVIGLTVGNGNLQLAPVIIGLTLTGLIYAGGHISGAHYNPAVSFAVFIRKKLSSLELLSYLLAQIGGGLLAALCCRLLIPEKLPQMPMEMNAIGKALAAEVIGTFGLVYVILNVATTKASQGKDYYGIAIGLALIGLISAFAGSSGAVFNPSVALALCLLNMISWGTIWIYLLAAAIAACLGALLINMMEKKV
jgi:aquaporin Z